MQYDLIYNRLCERGRLRYPNIITKESVRKKSSFPLERHRILPGCMGGRYVVGNVSWLTPREHIFAHALLVRMYPNNYKIAFALSAMCHLKVSRWRDYNSRKYEFLKGRLKRAHEERGRDQMKKNWERKEWRDKMSKACSEGQIRYSKTEAGKKMHSEHARRMMNELFADPVRKAAWVKKMHELQNTPEQRAALSKRSKGSRWITNGEENKRWFGEEIPSGYRYGRREDGKGILGRKLGPRPRQEIQFGKGQV